MRRKSERTKSISSPSTNVERPSRRSGRRGRKSPTRSPEPESGEPAHEEKVSETENDGDNEKQRDSSSDRDSEEHSTSSTRNRRRGRTPKNPVETSNSKAKRRRGRKSEDVEMEPIQEENGNDNKQEKKKTEVQEGEIPNSIEKRDQVNTGKIDAIQSAEIPQKQEEQPENIELNKENSFVKSSKIDEVDEKLVEPSVTGNQLDSGDEKNEKNESKNLQTEKSHPLTSSDKSPSDTHVTVSTENDKKEERNERKKSVDKIEPSDSNIRHESRRSKKESSERRRSDSRENRSHRDRSGKVRTEDSSRNENNVISKHEEKENEKRDDIEKPKSTEKLTQSQPIRKRRWLSRKASESKPQVLAISTDSLKNLISDVHPVPLSDVKLESSPEPEIVELPPKEEKRQKEKTRNRSDRNERRSRDRENSKRDDKTTLTSNRKISIVNDDQTLQHPPSPPRNISSNILYITNLVRPFTLLQLKGLLARTGKIVENGFWMDRIKSKCYVKYETEDQAIETRHALHGVRWPTSNPKCLNVDFGAEEAMAKAIESTLDETPRFGQDGVRDNRVIGTGWEKERFDFDEKKDIQVSRPVREWDVGKKEELEREMERGQRDRERDRKRSLDHDRENVRDRRRSTSSSPARKFKKKENEPPLRLLDDLFRKTKTAPCIYWLPLTPEQIAEKEEARRKHMEEHEKRMEELRKNREREREKERERVKEREKERRRERSNDRRRSRSRDKRRY